MRYRDKSVRSIAEMLSVLKAQSTAKQLIWFRGQSRSTWSLIPSLARKAVNLKAENALIKKFMQNAVPHMARTITEEWEWMFLMQHHRAPTRLLDWSESPLVALYFAVTANPKFEGAVWCLDPVALNTEAKLSFKFDGEIPAFGRDNVMSNYLPSKVDDGTALMNPVAIVGPRNTARMAAQLGTFTINHRTHDPIEDIGAAKHGWRWLISPAAKKNIASELAYLGISALTLFPELDKVADVSREILR
jgi:hypothetical protein